MHIRNLVFLTTILTACSSTNFNADSPSDGSTDSSKTDGQVVVNDSNSDTPNPFDGGNSDGVVSTDSTTDSPDVITIIDAPQDSMADVLASDAGDSGSSCGLDPAATDLYVDKSFSGTPTGAQKCPFKTIRDAVEKASSMQTITTIRVQGGLSGSQANYTESGTILLRPGLTLKGDGTLLVRVSGGGACKVGNCVIQMEAGSTVERLSVQASTGHGILIVGNSSTQTNVRNVSVSSAADSHAGILTTGGKITIGPGVDSTSNKGSGLTAWGNGVLAISGQSTAKNHFSFNLGHGMDIQGGVAANIAFTEANSNDRHGIQFTTNFDLSHTMEDSEAKSNKANGIALLGPITPGGTPGASSLFMRRTVMLSNLRYGLLLTSVANNIDLGIDPASGGNTFGYKTTLADVRNGYGGICLMPAYLKQLKSNGNRFNKCAPDQVSIKSCEVAPTDLNDYADIRYVEGATLPAYLPFQVTNCSTN